MSVLRSILTKAQEIKTTHWDFTDANSEQLKKLDKVLIQECTTIMIMRKELKKKLRNTSWKILANEFSLNAATTTSAVPLEVDNDDSKKNVSDIPTSEVVAPIASTGGLNESEVSNDISNNTMNESELLGDTMDIEDSVLSTSGDLNSIEVEQDQPGDDTFLSSQDVFEHLAKLLAWSDKKKLKVQKAKRIEELCFSEKCPSTSVITRELVDLLVKNGIFGEEVGSNYLPLRGQAPSFLARLRVAPLRISRSQLRSLYIDDFRFGELIQNIDKHFYELQEEALKKSGIKRASDKGLAKTQVQGTRVPLARFYKKILKKKFLDGVHPFWTTDIGQIWKLKGEDALVHPEASPTLSWREVYLGLQQIAPMVKDVIQISTTASTSPRDSNSVGMYDMEKSRLGGPNRPSVSHLSHLEGIEEDEDDLTAAHHVRNNSSLISSDDLVQLQLQLKQSNSKNAEMLQQVTSFQQIIQERDVQIQSLQQNVSELKNRAQTYTADHLQQAVEQTRKQSSNLIAQYQREVTQARELLQASQARESLQASQARESLQASQARELLQASQARELLQVRELLQETRKNVITTTNIVNEDVVDMSRSLASSFSSGLTSLADTATTNVANTTTNIASTTANKIANEIERPVSIFGDLRKEYRPARRN